MVFYVQDAKREGRVIIVMNRLSLVVILTLLDISLCTLTIHGSFAPSQTDFQFAYIVAANSLYLNYQLNLSPFYSSALLIGSNSLFNVSFDREDWIHFGYLQTTSCDYEGMVTGGSQYAWVQNRGIGTHVYFKLINFEPSVPFTFTITISESNSFLRSCPAGLMVSSNGLYCQFCDPAHIGAECGIKRHIANADSQNLLDLPSSSYTYYYLSTKGDISLTISANQTFLLYLQESTFQEQLAGVTNYFGDGQQGAFNISSRTTLQIGSHSGNILVGVINPHSNPVAFSLYFTQKQSVSLVIIVVSVLGGIILIAIIIFAIFIVRKMSNSRREVLPETALNRKRDKRLTQEEIETFFPPVALQEVQPQANKSTLYYKQQNLQDLESTDCIICLCEIRPADLARVGYCKHIFHANCLFEWFKKQQSCPYCRCQYNRQKTQEQYNKLSRKMGKALTGIEIPRALFFRGDGPSMNTINETELCGANY